MHAELTENGVVLCLPCEFRDGSVEMWSQKETIAWGPCTPPPTLETFGKEISLSTRSSIEIAGLLKKKLMMNNDDRDS